VYTMRMRGVEPQKLLHGCICEPQRAAVHRAPCPLSLLSSLSTNEGWKMYLMLIRCKKERERQKKSYYYSPWRQMWGPIAVSRTFVTCVVMQLAWTRAPHGSIVTESDCSRWFRWHSDWYCSNSNWNKVEHWMSVRIIRRSEECWYQES
jgi:hypothetical protein